jgi:hypothetical protein
VYSISTADIEQEWSNKLVNPCQDHIQGRGNSNCFQSQLHCLACRQLQVLACLVASPIAPIATRNLPILGSVLATYDH